MKNKKKHLLSVAWKPIPCKTCLRGNFQLSHNKYYNEAFDSCTKHFID